MSLSEGQETNSGTTSQKAEDWQIILYASFIAQILCITGFSASIPFIPLYLVKDLHITTSAEAGLWSGMMGASSAFVMAGLAPVWGALADRWGRKSMVLRAMIGGCILIALMAISTDVWMLLVLRILQGALTGTISANIALVASVTPNHRLGYALGIMQTAVFTGSSIGPLVGGTLADLTDYRFTFLITSAALGVAALIVVFFVHENFVPVRPDLNATRVSLAKRFQAAFNQPVFVAMLIILALVQFGSNVVIPVLALFIKTLNGSGEGVATLAGLELGITGIASAASAGFAGYLSDRYGHQRVLVISSVAAALLYFPQALVSNVWQLLFLRGLMGLFFGGVLPSANALIAQLIPEGKKGTAYGLVSSFSSLGFGAGPLAGSIVAALLTIRAVFVVTGIVLLVTAVWVRSVLSKTSIGLVEKPVPEPVTPQTEEAGVKRG